MNRFISIKDFGAVGDGVNDDSFAINAAVEAGECIYIPPGLYMIGKSIKLTSHTHITASPLAHIKLMAGAQKGRYDFLMYAAYGSCDISIDGGVWDGNCGENDRGNDLFSESATTGSMFSFRGVRDISLRNLKLMNPLCYYMRFCEAESVVIENIRFESDVISSNQDGIHLAGFCSNFVIRNLWGAAGSPNDDFIALNADDCITRQENLDMINGPIKNVLAENIYSEKCHCFIRLASVDSSISNVTARNVSGSCKQNVINADAARYCRVPIFKDEDRPDGVGNLENVLLENFSIYDVVNANDTCIALETNCTGLRICNFSCDRPICSLLRIAKTDEHIISYSGDNSDIMPEKTYRNENITLSAKSFALFEFNRKQ